MCRNIKTLYNFEPPATDVEIHAAALQFVRKISGFNKPSQANAEIFEDTVERIAANARALMNALVTNAPSKNRELEAEKARERARVRFNVSR